MRTMYGFLAALALLSRTPLASADEYDIIIVTGQSNAKIQFAEGVMASVQQSGLWENPVLFHTRHSGSPLAQWVGGEPGSFHMEDLLEVDFLAEGFTSKLDALIGSYEQNGHTAKVVAMFWFQGESDSVTADFYGTYYDRYEWMLKQMWQRFGRFEVVMTQIDSNQENPQYLEDLGIDQAQVDQVRSAQREIAQRYDLVLVDSREEERLDAWHVGDLGDPRGQYAALFDFGIEQAEAFLDRYRCVADLNGDRQLDYSDVSIFLESYNRGCPELPNEGFQWYRPGLEEGTDQPGPTDAGRGQRVGD